MFQKYEKEKEKAVLAKNDSKNQQSTRIRDVFQSAYFFDNCFFPNLPSASNDVIKNLFQPQETIQPKNF